MVSFLQRLGRLRLRTAGPPLASPNWLGVAGVIFVFAAVTADHDAVKELLVQWGVLRDAAAGDSAVFTWYGLVSLLKEVGFALLIAWGVSAGIEKQARERDEANEEAARGRIASDVIHAVYGLQHDANYVRMVIEKTLHSRVVRDRMSAEYIVEPLTKQEAQDLLVEENRFVKLTLFSHYAFVNVSRQSIDFPIRYSLAARFGSKIRDFARVRQISIGKRKLSIDEIEDGDRTKSEDAYRSYEWIETIPGGGRVDIMVEAVSIKELSDNEVWGSYHSTVKGMDFTAHVRIPDARFGLRDLTASPAELVMRRGDGATWKIDGPILPNDCLVFWWRVPEDDGVSSSTVDNSSEAINDTLTDNVENAT